MAATMAVMSHPVPALMAGANLHLYLRREVEGVKEATQQNRRGFAHVYEPN